MDAENKKCGGNENNYTNALLSIVNNSSNSSNNPLTRQAPTIV